MFKRKNEKQKRVRMWLLLFVTLSVSLLSGCKPTIKSLLKKEKYTAEIHQQIMDLLLNENNDEDFKINIELCIERLLSNEFTDDDSMDYCYGFIQVVRDYDKLKYENYVKKFQEKYVEYINSKYKDQEEREAQLIKRKAAYSNTLLDSGDISQCDTISLGNYYLANDKVKQPVEWCILHKDKENRLITLITRDIIDVSVYSEKGMADPFGVGEFDEVKFADNVSYKSSYLREYINNYLYNEIFNDQEKRILENQDFGDKLSLIDFNKFSDDFGKDRKESKHVYGGVYDTYTRPSKLQYTRCTSYAVDKYIKIAEDYNKTHSKKTHEEERIKHRRYEITSFNNDYIGYWAKGSDEFGPFKMPTYYNGLTEEMRGIRPAIQIKY